MLDHTIQDLRFSLRQLAKSKVFTITAVITLALGIGGNAAIFTLIDAVMLKSLPVADPASLYRLGDGDNCCVLGGYQDRVTMYSYDLYKHLAATTPEFVQLAAFQGFVNQVGVRRPGTADAPEAFGYQLVSGNYFEMFGLHAFAGRLITPADDSRTAVPVAVMSYRAWVKHYGSDPTVIGSTLIIDGAPYAIAGIAPAGFFGDTLRPNPPDFWMPLETEPAARKQNSILDHKDTYWLYSIGRVKPGASIPQIEARVSAAMGAWQTQNDPPVTARDRERLAKLHVNIVPAGAGIAQMREEYSRDLVLLMAITGLVLLVACANLANLQLARGASNLSQTSIRVALGAPRSRLVQQAITESVVLAVIGGGVGLLVATNVSGLLTSLAFLGANFVPIQTTPSPLVIGFTLVLSVVTGIIFGIAPAWTASRADPADALRGAGRSHGGRETIFQRSLVVLQAALSLVLLIGAGLMLQTLRNLTNQQFGFHSENRVVVNVNASFSGYALEKVATEYRELEMQLRGIGGVRDASLSLYSPMAGDNWEQGISIEDHPAPAGQRYGSSWDRVSPSFFNVLGSRMVHGRMFEERDLSAAQRVAVINQAFAEKFFAHEDPIGKRFGLGGDSHRADFQIVGVVENVRFRNPRRATPPFFFLPLSQLTAAEWTQPDRARSNLIGNIELLTSANAPTLASDVRRVLASIDPNFTMLNLMTMEDQIDVQVQHERLISQLAELFGLLALALASVGIYGLTAYSIQRRMNEMGIRTALGASRGDIIGLVLGGALKQIGIGLLIGIPAAYAAARILGDQLYGVKSDDALIFGIAIVVLTCCTCIAAYLPAVRASSVDPVRALRAE